MQDISTEPARFGQLVKLVRSQLGLSQEDLAHQIGVSYATVNRWENGKVKPSRLARMRFDNYCKEKKRHGGLSSPLEEW